MNSCAGAVVLLVTVSDLEVVGVVLVVVDVVLVVVLVHAGGVPSSAAPSL